MKEKIDERRQSCERACLKRCSADEEEEDKLLYQNVQPWPNPSTAQKGRQVYVNLWCFHSKLRTFTKSCEFPIFFFTML